MITKVILLTLTHNVKSAVIGTAVALNMLFKVPIWSGVLLAGLSTLLLLGIQKYGVSDILTLNHQLDS